MELLQNYCLKLNNTLGVDAVASVYAKFDTDEEIINYILTHIGKFKQVKHLVIGEGSNLLFTGDFFGMIIHPRTKDIILTSEDKNYFYYTVSAGVIWDDFVAKTLEEGAYGLENLSLIPGTVGASAVQNIGAYGAEVKDFIQKVKYINLHTGELVTISGSECDFSYRNSIFKNDLKNEILILSVEFRLNKKCKLNCDYADISSFFQGRKDMSALEVREAVIQIRNAKLPDPKLIGNAGSFFKNPIITKEKFELLLKSFPDIRYYALENGDYKLAAAWMIDKCGLKGFAHNGAAVHENHALVLINKSGSAKGQDIQGLAYIVREKVAEKFDIILEPEVVFI